MQKIHNNIIDEIDNSLILFGTLEVVLVREILYLKKSPTNLYSLTPDIRLEIKANTTIESKQIKYFIKKKIIYLYCKTQETHKIRSLIQAEIHSLSRSLSIGQSLSKSCKLASLMVLNQKYILEDIVNDYNIKLQYQTAKNLILFLLENPNYIRDIYKDLVKQKFYFIYSQPLISSLFLLGITIYSKNFSAKNIQSLFFVSLFKDLGMCYIPSSLLNKKDLKIFEQNSFLAHQEFSAIICKSSLPLSSKYINIIRYHHLFRNLKNEENIIDLFSEKLKRNKIKPSLTQKQIILGSECILVGTCDMIAAMIHGRPYRNPLSLYDSLSVIRELLKDDYPLEFKLILNFFKYQFKIK